MGSLNILEDFEIRIDGRLCEDLRKISCKFGCVGNANGSVQLEQGKTIIRAAVYGPKQPTRKGHGHLTGEALTKMSLAGNSDLTVECHYYDALTRNTSSYENIQIASIIKSAASSVLLPIGNAVNIRSVVVIQIEAISSDGSALAAAVNATTLALINAGLPLRDTLCASTVARLRQVTIVDPNRKEEIFKPSMLTVLYCPKLGELVNVVCARNVHLSDYEGLLASCIQACEGVACVLQDVIMRHSSDQLAKRQSSGIYINMS